MPSASLPPASPPSAMAPESYVTEQVEFAAPSGWATSRRWLAAMVVVTVGLAVPVSGLLALYPPPAVAGAGPATAALWLAVALALPGGLALGAVVVRLRRSRARARALLRLLLAAGWNPQQVHAVVWDAPDLDTLEARVALFTSTVLEAPH